MMSSKPVLYLIGDARGLALVILVAVILVYIVLRGIKKRKRPKTSQDSEVNTFISEMSLLHTPGLPEFHSLQEFEAWQRTRRQDFISRMLYPYPDSVEFEEKESVVKGGFRQQAIEVIYQKKPLFRYFRLSPNGSNVQGSEGLPVVLAFMGHGNVNHVLDGVDSYQKGFAADFARAGYLVYVMENVGMEPNRDFHLALDQALRLEGRSWYSMLFAHQRIVLDQIFLDPEADHNRVGAVGVSTGGLLAISAAAQEPRVTAACVQGFFGRMRNSFIKDRRRHCHCGAIVGILPDFDVPILALLVAPRDLQISNGARDSFPSEEAKHALESMRPIMQKFSFPEPEFIVTPGGHEFDVSSAMAFFRKRFNTN